MRSIQGRPVDLLQAEYPSMLTLPPIAPPTGLSARVRLGREYYLRLDTVDYSVDSRAIGRFVDASASLDTVTVICDGQTVARHRRSWAKHAVVTDPDHKQTAAKLRHASAQERQRRQAATRYHADGHVVSMRALPDYDALFGVDFAIPSMKASSE